MSALAMPDMAAGTCAFDAVLRAPLYWVKPSPSSRSAESLNDVPEMEKLAATAPEATPATSPTATTVGATITRPKRRQLVRPSAEVPCESFTDPPREVRRRARPHRHGLASTGDPVDQPSAERTVDAVV